MPITNGYTTLADLKERLGIEDTQEDTILEAVINAASRAIDDYTGRRFYATTETRYYSAEGPDVLFVDDLLSVTSLKTDDDGTRAYATAWASTDYDLGPFNGTPKVWIQVTPNGLYRFPCVARGVEIAGSWGFAASAPDAVTEACLLQAARLYKRKDAPMGNYGVAEIGEGSARVLDPDVKALLGRFQRIEVL